MPLPQVGQTQLMLCRCFFLDVVVSTCRVQFDKAHDLFKSVTNNILEQYLELRNLKKIFRLSQSCRR